MLREGELAERMQRRLEAEYAAKVKAIHVMENELATLKATKPIDHHVAAITRKAAALESLRGPT